MLQLFVGFLISFSFLLAPFSFLFEFTTAFDGAEEGKEHLLICWFFVSFVAHSLMLIFFFNML